MCLHVQERERYDTEKQELKKEFETEIKQLQENLKKLQQVRRVKSKKNNFVNNIFSYFANIHKNTQSQLHIP